MRPVSPVGPIPETAPIPEGEVYAEPAAFIPANLLREARRQKALPEGLVPRACVPDPDGDVVEHLLETEQAGLLRDALDGEFVRGVNRGTSWTTDAPFRETATEVERHRSAGVEGDFEKGAPGGSADALGVVEATARCRLSRGDQPAPPGAGGR